MYARISRILTNKALFWVIGFLLFLSVLMSCKRDKPDQTGSDQIAAPTLDKEIEVAVSAGKTSYTLGDSIEFTMIVSSRMDEPVKFVFSTSQPYDFIVRDSDGEEIWRFTHGKAFSQVVTPTELEPSEKVVYIMRWNGETNRGTSVALGRYTVQCCLLSNPPVCSQKVEFNIVD
ncbi:hypothetical protein JW877_01600 [bacterium]|nr:hypothetical protein [bacterium]